MNRASTDRVATLERQLLGFQFNWPSLLTCGEPPRLRGNTARASVHPELIAQIVNADYAIVKDKRRVATSDITTLLLLKHEDALATYGQSVVESCFSTRNLLSNAVTFGLQGVSWWEPARVQSFAATGLCRTAGAAQLARIAGCEPPIFTALRNLASRDYGRHHMAYLAGAAVVAMLPFQERNAAIGFGLMNWALVAGGYRPMTHLASPTHYLSYAVGDLLSKGHAEPLLHYLAQSARVKIEDATS
jgi:hypothetical protein